MDAKVNSQEIRYVKLHINVDLQASEVHTIRYALEHFVENAENEYAMYLLDEFKTLWEQVLDELDKTRSENDKLDH